MPCIYTLNSMAICEVSQDTKFRTHFSVTLDVHFLPFYNKPFFSREFDVFVKSHTNKDSVDGCCLQGCGAV